MRIFFGGGMGLEKKMGNSGGSFIWEEIAHGKRVVGHMDFVSSYNGLGLRLGLRLGLFLGLG